MSAKPKGIITDRELARLTFKRGKGEPPGLNTVLRDQPGPLVLSGIEYCTGIEYLSFRSMIKFQRIGPMTARAQPVGTQFVDLSLLGRLPRLKVLEFDIATSLDGIEQCKNLRELRIRSLGDKLPSLRELSKLEVLEVGLGGWSRDGNLTGLETCTNLRELRWQGAIDSLKPLGQLLNLRVLWLKRNWRTGGEVIQNDLAPLAGLKKLQKLSLSGVAAPNRTTTKLDLTHRSGLTELQELDLQRNQIDVLAGLDTLKELRVLLLEDNEISNLSPLRALFELKVLYLDYNQVHDLSALAELTKLELLSLEDNKVSDLEPLKNLTALTLLCLNRNKVQDVSALSGLPKIGGSRKSGLLLSEIEYPFRWTHFGGLHGMNSRDVGLGLRANQISDVAPLVNNDGFGSESVIDLNSNPLNDEAYERDIPALQERGVYVSFDK